MAVVLLAVGLAPAGARAAETLVVPPRLRLLVVAPHPDDESLAAGGLMQVVRARGGSVHVVFVTNGDGYPEAATAAVARFGSPDRPASGAAVLGSADFRTLGVLRAAEALAAVAHAGVLPDAVTFLGFPDGGLATVWRRRSGEPPFESPYTRIDHPPYPDVLDAGARYRRADLVRALARLVARVRPDWIVVPSPRDNHGDHCATFAFLVTALRAVAAEAGGGRATPARLLTYLVHTSRGWPPPPEAPGPLPEPAPLPPGARWASLPLGEPQVAAKRAALASHRTQTAVMASLFRSFVRPNELFGVVERADLAALVPGASPCSEAPLADH